MKRTFKVNNWLNTIQNFCYPASCVLCGAPGHHDLDLCRNCHDELPFNTPACKRCALPLPVEAEICGNCQRRPPSFHHSFALFRYQPPLDHLLLRLKFHQRLHLASLLGTLMARQLAVREAPLPELIVPVPLHPGRLRGRGYNQALELARPIAKRLQLPMDTRLCRRIRPTASQSQLPAAERRKNMRGAFQVGELGKYTHVAIIDDVITTGSTVEELARQLLRAGAGKVEVWALARALV